MTSTTKSGTTTLQQQIVRNYNPFRYRGYYYDTNSSLYYLQSRYYDPANGRFINADGYVSTGTGLLGYNMYAYCSNNPIMYTDNSGDFPALFLLVTMGILLLTMNSCTPADRYKEIKIEGGWYNTLEKAIDEAYNYVSINGSVDGNEYATIIYTNKYEENQFKIFSVYTDNKSGSVKYRNLYQDEVWIPVVFIHYHPTGGDSTYFSGGDLQLASEHQVGLCVINRDGVTAQNFKKLYERNDKPFYLKSWDNIWDYIEWED